MSNPSNFFSKIGINLDDLKTNFGKDNPIDPKILESLNQNFKDLTEEIDYQNDSIKAYKQSLDESRVSLAKATNDKEVKKYTKEIAALDKALKHSQYSVQETGKALENFLKESSNKNKVDPNKLYEGLKGFDSLGNSLKGSGKQLSSLGNLSKGFFSGFSGSAGKAFGEMSGFLGKGLADPMTALIAIGEMAAAQIVDLNDKLILFQRTMSGGIGYDAIGYDAYGNSQNVGRASLSQSAAINGVSDENVLDTYKAFKQGSGTIGSVDIQGNSKELQDYGVEVAKMNKMYGVTADVSSKVSKVLTQQYGKGVKETSDLMEKGAKTAHEAGVNVGIFFDNLAAISDLQGQLFIRGGAEGMEKAALGMAKLGLGIEKISKLQDSYTGFTDLIDKQQKAVAMGMNNLASIQNRVFAKINTGDTQGAVELRQMAGAKDIQGQTTKDGKITQQGIQMLSSQGFDKEEIASIERINKSSQKLGLSIEQVVTKNNLSIEQRRKLDEMDQEQLTIKEKLNKMWGQIKAVVVDPVAALLTPFVSGIIDTVGRLFDWLSYILKPVIALFQGIGTILGKLGKVTNNFFTAIFNLWKKVMSIFGGGNDKGEDTYLLKGIQKIVDAVVWVIEKISDFIGGIFDAINGVLDAIIAIKNFFTAEGLKKGWNNIVNSVVPGSSQYIGFGGEDKGKTASGSYNNMVSSSGSQPPTKDDLINLANENNMKIEMFNPEFWSKLEKLWDKKTKDKDMQVKIASLAGTGGVLPELSKIMEGKKFNNELQIQSEKENMINNAGNLKPQQIVVNVVNNSHLIGGLNARNASR